MKLLRTAIIFAAGYLCGTRAGRGQYETLKSKAEQIWQNPKVQDKVGAATNAVKRKTTGSGDSVGTPGDDTEAAPPEPDLGGPARVHAASQGGRHE